MSYGKKIKKIRKLYGLSQVQFAEKVLISADTVADWEGDKYLPNLSTVELIAIAFDASISDILEGV